MNGDIQVNTSKIYTVLLNTLGVLIGGLLTQLFRSYFSGKAVTIDQIITPVVISLPAGYVI